MMLPAEEGGDVGGRGREVLREDEEVSKEDEAVMEFPEYGQEEEALQVDGVGGGEEGKQGIRCWPPRGGGRRGGGGGGGGFGGVEEGGSVEEDEEGLPS